MDKALQLSIQQHAHRGAQVGATGIDRYETIANLKAAGYPGCLIEPAAGGFNVQPVMRRLIDYHQKRCARWSLYNLDEVTAYAKAYDSDLSRLADSWQDWNGKFPAHCAKCGHPMEADSVPKTIRCTGPGKDGAGCGFTQEHKDIRLYKLCKALTGWDEPYSRVTIKAIKNRLLFYITFELIELEEDDDDELQEQNDSPTDG